MMSSFEQQLQEYRKQLRKLVPTTSQKKKANFAGAKVYQERLTEVTRS